MSSSHKNGPRFRIDDYVYFSPPRAQQSHERFIVIGVLPQDREGSYQYRIRPTVSGPHRIATELELRR